MAVHPQSAVWEDIHCRKKWQTNAFELSVDLGDDIGRKVFYWKRTTDVGDTIVVTRRFDGLHLKLIEAGSERVVARFVHRFAFGSKRGNFELLEYDGGSKWESVVILSGSSVLEYLRKVSGWSW